jgi:hypothetical protein
MNLPTTLCQLWFNQQRHHIMDMSIGNFVRICSTMNAFVKGSGRQLRYLESCSWLWDILGYKVIQALEFMEAK